jgi:hypothetical protein
MTCSKATCTLTQWTGGDQPLMLDDEEMAPPPVTSPVGKDTTTDAEVSQVYKLVQPIHSYIS